jgi:hypothetical protein
MATFGLIVLAVSGVLLVVLAAFLGARGDSWQAKAKEAQSLFELASAELAETRNKAWEYQFKLHEELDVARAAALAVRAKLEAEMQEAKSLAGKARLAERLHEQVQAELQDAEGRLEKIWMIVHTPREPGGRLAKIRAILVESGPLTDRQAGCFETPPRDGNLGKSGPRGPVLPKPPNA